MSLVQWAWVNPHEGATCALEALGMKPRVSALWGDKSVFWFTTWTWPEFRSENSFGILGYRRNDDLGICFAFLFRNLSNHVDLFFLCAHFARVWHMCTLTPSHVVPSAPPPIVPLSLFPSPRSPS